MITNLSSSVNLETPLVSSKEKIGVWIHKHPTIVKTAEISSMVLGLGALASLPFTAPAMGTGLIFGSALAGASLALASAAAMLGLDILVPPHHDMHSHVFKPAECDGGKLFYQGDVPILTLESDDPYKAGVAHGYLCGDVISQLTKRFDLVLHTLAKRPRAHQILPELLTAIRQEIPERYLEEMKGLLDGCNKWAKENWLKFPKTLTLDDLLLFHLMPDSLHFHPQLFQAAKRSEEVQNEPSNIEELAIACTAIVDHHPSEGFVFARNMDWPSFGVAGKYSLVINRKHANQLHNTVEVGIPGVVGTLTGMNDKNLCLAMNVCSGFTREIRGMPACLFNRSILETCSNTQEIEKAIQESSPLGPYHLTTADPNNALSIHFYQSDEETHVTRRWSEAHPLTTLNCRYNPTPNQDMHHSTERQEVIEHFFQQRAPLEDALTLPYVNNWITTHRVVMKPQDQVFQVAFDNAFAGSAPLQTVSTENLLTK